MPIVPEPLRRAGAALLEACAWLLPAAAFLCFYTARTGADAAAVLAHLRVLLALIAATVVARWSIHAVAGRRVAAAAGALITALVLCALWLYYAVAVGGFDAWDNLVSWSLITTYARQAGYVTAVFGPAAYALAGLGLAMFLGLLAALHALYRREVWVTGVAGRLGPFVFGSGAFTAAVAVAVFFWDFAAVPPTQEREPFALTFWPEPLERNFLPHARTGAAQFAGVERAAYAAAIAHRQPSAGTNVILIVSDALRSRNMGVYGYPRPTTPYLSQLVASGSARRILRAESVCSVTVCGLLGIASSRYTHQFGGNPMTLAEVLRMQGYQAQMVLGGDHSNFYGLRALYGAADSYFDGSMSGGYMNDDEHIVAAVRRLHMRAAQGNFVQVHLMSTHLLGRRTLPDRFGEAQAYYRVPGGSGPSDDERRRFINFYDAGVAQADENIRRVLQVLADKGLMKDALVIVTADHGEFVGEHGLFGHAKTVRGEVIDIPLILASVGKARALDVDERGLASQVDIAPTVLSQLDLPIPAGWSGIPLQSRTNAVAGRQVFFQQGAEFGLVERSPSGRTWKYWVDARSGQEFAFDLDADALETRNRATELAATDRNRWRRSLLLLEAGVRASLAPN